LSLGLAPDRLGAPLERLVMLDWPEIQVAPRGIEGSILTIDSFGNLVTDIPAELLPGAAEWDRMQVWCRGHRVAGMSQTYGDRVTGTLTALVGSTGRLEIAVARGSAAATIQAHPGDAVHVTW
jgi:S-adenosylmethionine hydrolase